MSYIRRAIVSIATLMLMLVFPAVSAAAVDTPPEPATTSTAAPCPTNMKSFESRCLSPKDPSSMPAREGWIPLDAGPSTEERLKQRVEDLTLQVGLLWAGFIGTTIGIFGLSIALVATKQREPSASTNTTM